MSNWIALDWGTSNLRAYYMDSRGQLLDSRGSDCGMSTLANPAEFEAALLPLVESWFDPTSKTQILACGMVGAKQGWFEAPYTAVPCQINNLHTINVTAVQDSRIELHITAGLCQHQPADVMRGEETQIAGLLKQTKLTDAYVCLPGTHNKWVTVENAQVDSFQTCMTGEVFALLAGQSVLKHSVDVSGFNKRIFQQSVRDGYNNPSALLSDTFGIRAQSLLIDYPPADGTGRLSGLLIGAELAGTKSYWQGHTVDIIAGPSLADNYSEALEVLGSSVRLHDATQCTLDGLIAVYNQING